MGTCCTRGATPPDFINTDRSVNIKSDYSTQKQYTIDCSTSDSESKHDTDDSISYSMTDELDNLHHQINMTELGQFIRQQMNNKTLELLWKHLDEHDSKQIERRDMFNVLECMVVLYVSFRYRV